jgi:hypothetical protein
MGGGLRHGKIDAYRNCAGYPFSALLDNDGVLVAPVRAVHDIVTPKMFGKQSMFAKRAKLSNGC